jgi:hypothetical protein
MAFRVLFSAFAVVVACLAQPRVPQRTKGPRPADPDVSEFVPATAKLIKQLRVDFDVSGGIEIVLAYASDTGPNITTGVRVLKYSATSGWAVVLEETDGLTNGAGASDAINIDKIRATSGIEGVVVALHNSAAGTATMWHVLASAGNKISRLDPEPSRAKVFKHKGYQDWGYNGVTSEGSFVIESQPGYSRKTARCCPDRPSIEMRFRFTGSSIVLESVKELPFHPAKY